MYKTVRAFVNLYRVESGRTGVYEVAYSHVLAQRMTLACHEPNPVL